MIVLKTVKFSIKYRFLGSSFYIILTPLFMIFAQKNIVIQDISQNTKHNTFTTVTLYHCNPRKCENSKYE